jgi:rubrerythrin
MSGVVDYNVREVLVACRDLEMLMASLYDMLAKIHADVPSMAKLWSKTANEERNHAAQFGLVLDIRNEAVEAVRVDLSEVGRMHRAVEMLCQECATRPPAVDDALRTAIAFEEALMDLHAHQVPIFTHDSHKNLFAAMMAADREHVGRLRRALTLGSSAPTPAPVPPVHQHRK